MLEKFVTHFGNELKDDEWYEDSNFPDHFLLKIVGGRHESVDPVIQVFRLSGTDYIYIDVDSIDIDQSNNDVVIRVPKSPNGIFAGRIVII